MKYKFTYTHQVSKMLQWLQGTFLISTFLLNNSSSLFNNSGKNDMATLMKKFSLNLITQMNREKIYT